MYPSCFGTPVGAAHVPSLAVFQVTFISSFSFLVRRLGSGGPVNNLKVAAIEHKYFSIVFKCAIP